MQQHWTGYLNAVAGQKVPNSSMPQTAPYETSSSETGATGFMDLLVKQPKIQAQYDAMQGTWEGPAASEAATANNVFKTESMPIPQKQVANKK